MAPVIADRLANLGTETAYKISADAGALEKTGKKVYRFHIGDLSFTPPKEFTEGVHQAMLGGKTGYCLARGIADLREKVAERCGEERGISFTPDQVLVQPGGKPVIMKFLMSTMNPGDGVLFPTPGYPLYESLIRFLGGVPLPYGYKEGPNGVELDFDSIKAHVDSSVPIKCLIFNNMHNPTGHCASKKEMEGLGQLSVQNDWWVLSDEAYFRMNFEAERRSLASLDRMAGRTCILLTCSKEWAMTGMRCGMALGPKHLIDQMERLTVNDEGCTNQAVQWGTIPCYEGKCDSHTDHIRSVLLHRRDLLCGLVNQIVGFHCMAPEATFYMWVNVTAACEILGAQSVEAFRLQVLTDTGVAFCTRDHFGDSLPSETERFIRLSFAGIPEESILEAMGVLKEYMEAAAAKFERPRAFSTRWVDAEARATAEEAMDCWNTTYLPSNPRDILERVQGIANLLITPEHMPEAEDPKWTWQELCERAGSSLKQITLVGFPQDASPSSSALAYLPPPPSYCRASE